MKTVASIVIDENAIYTMAMKGTPENHEMVSYNYLERSGHDIYDDLDHVLQGLPPVNAVGIVESTPPVFRIEEMTEVINPRTASLIHSLNSDDLVYDSLKFINNKGVPMVFSVGIPCKVVETVTAACADSHAPLALIDYWPYGITDGNRKEVEVSTDIIESDEGITGYLWYKNSLMEVLGMGADESPESFLKSLWMKQPDYDFTKHPITISVNPCHKEEWSKVVKPYCHNSFKTNVPTSSGNTGSWNVSRGMALRLLKGRKK